MTRSAGKNARATFSRAPPQSKRGSVAEALALGVVERLVRDRRAVMGAEDVDVDLRALGRELRWQPAQQHPSPDGVAEVGAGHVADGVAVALERLAAVGGRVDVVEHEAAQALARPARTRGERGLTAVEVRLREVHREAETGFERRVLAGHVDSREAVALLHAQGVERARAAGHDARVGAGLEELIPEIAPVLGRRVELPAQLACVGDAQRQGGHRADPDLARAQVREREVVRAQPRQHLVRARAPEPQHAERRGDVAQAHGVALGQLAAQPGDVARARAAARDEQVALVGQSRDGEVADAATVVVEHRRVEDAADRAVHLARADAVEPLGDARPLGLDLDERREVEHADARARGQVLAADRRRPVPLRPRRAAPASRPAGAARRWRGTTARAPSRRSRSARRRDRGSARARASCARRADGPAPDPGG